MIYDKLYILNRDITYTQSNHNFRFKVYSMNGVEHV